MAGSVKLALPRALSAGIFQRYLGALIVIFAATVVSLLWIGVALLVRQERTDAVERVKRENANLASAYAEHTFRTLNYVDQLSVLVAAQYQKLGLGFDMPRYFEENHVDQKLVVNSVISDVAGLTVLGSQRGFQPANLADREHVKIHVARDSGKLYIGKPVLARVAKRWSFIATRRANNPDGSYAGVVGIGLDPFYFSTFYKQADLGKDSFVSLTGTDGVIRARIVGADQSVGQDVSKGTVFKAFSTADSGTLMATGTIDGVPRIYAYHRVQEFPLFITVGSSEAVALAPVQAHQRFYYTVAAVVSIILSLSASGLTILWQRQQSASEKVLGENRQRLMQQNEMLVAMSEAQAAYLARGDWKAATARLLRFALDQSRSQHGFVGVLISGSKFRILAQEGFDWRHVDGCEFYQEARAHYPEQGYWEFTHLDNSFGAAVRMGRATRVNELSKGLSSAPAPQSHPPLENYLGLPIRAGDKVIGLIGLANRPGGFDAAVQTMLERLLGLAEPVCDSYLIGLEQERLRAEQKQAEAQIRLSLEEKEVLLREIHHRVKNNLAIISSLLSLQASAVGDRATQEAFRESQDRVWSMALVHEQLYRSAILSHLDFGEHLRELGDNVARSYGAHKRGVRLELDVIGVLLDLDTAIPVSLIFNELLSNAYKHAYPVDRTGRIEVILAHDGVDRLLLRVSDDGVGLRQGVDLASPSTLGLKIVQNLTEQIHGRIEIHSNSGTTFLLRFPFNSLNHQRARADVTAS
ncbi:MAG TPA: histidine kinase dimerization/phosphoacceptor domain -containing protein [Candidatus Binatus sp.]|nr:histidine kinase dimerization/phosphoacceptor domain -containing protein [Candidatus Binatus sp.]